MARQINKLNARGVQTEDEIGLHADGGGLYLRVTASGGKFWAFRYIHVGKAREMGLGAVHAISLSDARLKAVECRKLLSEGIDPIDARDEGKAQSRLEAAKSKTFKQCAEAYIKAHEPEWSSAKHRWQWQNTLEKFVYPIIGDVSVQKIDAGMIFNVLDPIWVTKTETAIRVRGRIEAILDWAKTSGYRTGENPARWRGNLQNLLAAPSRIQRVEHQPSLPYTQIGGFLKALEHQAGAAARALAFAILTASRTSEVLKMTWDEVDVKKGIWVIPAGRIKARKEHKVPLSEPVLGILATIREENAHQKLFCRYVFPSNRSDRPLSDMSMLAVLRRMKYDDITVHGFRTTFRVWAAEQTNYPREVAEAALAHVNRDKVEAAYMRTDFFEKRIKLMDEWAEYCFAQSQLGENVIAGVFPKKS